MSYAIFEYVNNVICLLLGCYAYIVGLTLLALERLVGVIVLVEVMSSLFQQSTVDGCVAVVDLATDRVVVQLFVYTLAQSKMIQIVCIMLDLCSEYKFVVLTPATRRPIHLQHMRQQCPLSDNTK